MKIAICSVNENAYSETFIRAHRDLVKDIVLFYHSGWVPRFLGDHSILPSGNLFNKSFRRLLKELKISNQSDSERGFLRSLKHEQPDVVLAEYAVCGAEITPILKKLNIPLVIHCHGFDVSHKPTLDQYKEKYLQAFEYAHSVIGVSKVMCRNLEELGCPKKKIIYCCYGPNPDFFKVTPDYNAYSLLAIGRLVEKKAPHLTLLAFAKARERVPTATLKIVGDGPLLNVCKDLAKAMEIDSFVHFEGPMTPQQIMYEMKQASCFIQHSKTSEDGDMEGTPVGILEAQAAGLPVISTIHGGIVDVVVNNETGFLSEEGDIETMATNIVTLLQDKEMRVRFGNNARERIKNNFTLEQHIRTLQQVLEQASMSKK